MSTFLNAESLHRAGVHMERLMFGYRPNGLRPDLGRTGKRQEKSPKAGQISSSIHGQTHGERLGELLRQVVLFRQEEKTMCPHVDPSTLSLVDPIITDELLGRISKDQATPVSFFNILIGRISNKNNTESISQIVRGLAVDEWQLPKSDQDRVMAYMHVVAQELAVGIAMTRVKEAVADAPDKKAAAKAVVEGDAVKKWELDTPAWDSLRQITSELIENLEKGNFEVKRSEDGSHYLRLAEPEKLATLPKDTKEQIEASIKRIMELNPDAVGIAEKLLNHLFSSGTSADRLDFNEALKEVKKLGGSHTCIDKSNLKSTGIDTTELWQALETAGYIDKKGKVNLEKSKEQIEKFMKDPKVGTISRSDIPKKEFDKFSHLFVDPTADLLSFKPDTKEAEIEKIGGSVAPSNIPDKEFDKVKHLFENPDPASPVLTLRGNITKKDIDDISASTSKKVINTLQQALEATNKVKDFLKQALIDEKSKKEKILAALQNAPKIIEHLTDILNIFFEFYENQLHSEEAEFLEFLYRKMVDPNGRSAEEIAEHAIITRKIPKMVEPGAKVDDNQMRDLFRTHSRLIEAALRGTGPAAGDNVFEQTENLINYLRPHVTYANAGVTDSRVNRDFEEIASPFDQERPINSVLNARYLTLFDDDYRVREGYPDKFLYYYNNHPAYYYMGMPQAGRNLSNIMALSAQDGMDAYWGKTLKVDSLPKINSVLPWGAGMSHNIRTLVEDSEWIPAMDYKRLHKRPYELITEHVINKINTKSKNPVVRTAVAATRTFVKVATFLNPIVLAAQLIDVFIVYPYLNEFHESAVHHVGNIKRKQEIDFSQPLWYQPISSETRSESEDMGTAPHHLKLIKMASRYTGVRSWFSKHPLRRSAFIQGKVGRGSNYDDYRVMFNTVRARWSRGNQSIGPWVLKTPMALLTRIRFKQRIDYWTMQLKRMSFLGGPIVFGALGLTPVMVSNWYIAIAATAITYALGMGTYFQEMRTEGKSIRACLRSIVQDYYGMLQGAKTTIAGKYLNTLVTFVVSPKKTYTTFKTPAKELAFEWTVLGLNAGIAAMTTTLGVMSFGLPFGWLMFSTAFWALHNVAFIGTALMYLNRGTKVEADPSKWIKEYEQK